MSSIKQTVWMRRSQVRERYGNISDTTLDRHVKAAKLPPPKYPFDNRIPFWNVAELDESDKAAAAAYRKQPSHKETVA
jgi:hypothetical protein